MYLHATINACHILKSSGILGKLTLSLYTLD
jgi:hypothetical protein